MALMDRRRALQLGAACVAGSLAGAANAAPAAKKTAAMAARKENSAAKRSLDILVLGGTRFVGPEIVRAALARGHKVTLFNRGMTRPWLFPGPEHRKGNRYPEKGEGLAALATGEWDAVIDVPAYFPRIVDSAASLLKDRARHYLMISSISVYQDFRTVGLDENSAVRTLRGEYAEREDLSEDWDFATYGARKALCEQAAALHFPGRSTSLRCCGIAGGGLSDPSKWVWPARFATMDKVAAGGEPEDHMQIVDRRDVAQFAIRAIEQSLFGVYNVIGHRATFRDVLETTRAAVGSSAGIVWTGETGREQLSPLPAAAPESRVPGFAAVSGAKALAAGFTARPLIETFAADWLWFRENMPLDFDFFAAGHGPDPAKEAALLKEFA